MILWKGKYILEVKDLRVGMIVEYECRERTIENIRLNGGTNNEEVTVSFSGDTSNTFWPTMYATRIPDCYTNIYYISGKTIIDVSELPTLSSKGKTHCPSCECPTEMKRDFSDMSVREFCPRCKI